jgi:hypothetical protein
MGENEAVRLVGLDVNGGPVFDVVLSVPDALAMDRHCSEAQLAAVTKFYCRDFAADVSWSWKIGQGAKVYSAV